MATPTRCTPDNVALVCERYAEATARMRDAPAGETTSFLTLGAALRGVVHETNYRLWRREAAAGREPFADAVTCIEAARREHLAPLVARIADIAFHGTKDQATQLNALKFLLERLGGDDWNPAAKAEVSGPDGGPISVAVDPADLAAKIDALAARDAAEAPADGAGEDPGEPD